MGRRLSPLGTVLKRTATRIFKRFLILYLLASLSLFFLMAIGIFISMIGIDMFFPEAVPPTQHMLPIMLTGIAAFLFISLFCQAALISALVNEQAGLLDSIAIASRKFFSYTALFLVLVFLIWGGFMLMYLPGVIVLVLFSFSPLILISENESVLGAMRKNIRYLSGMWIPLLLRLVPVALSPATLLHETSTASPPFSLAVDFFFSWMHTVSSQARTASVYPTQEVTLTTSSYNRILSGRRDRLLE